MATPVFDPGEITQITVTDKASLEAIHASNEVILEAKVASKNTIAWRLLFNINSQIAGIVAQMERLKLENDSIGP